MWSTFLVTAAVSSVEIVAPNPKGLNNPCMDSTGPYHAQPWCNVTLDIDVRVADMISRMTIAEKIPTLDTSAPGIQSLGLNGYNWWEEASTGVSNNHQTTKFAYPITTGMSFNRTLWQVIRQLTLISNTTPPPTNHLLISARWTQPWSLVALLTPMLSLSFSLTGCSFCSLPAVRLDMKHVH